MIAFLRGRPVTAGFDFVVLDVGGIGYKVFMPVPAATSLNGSSDTVTVHTYLHVREDAMQLFGFLQEKDLEVFEMLLQVSGIGPRVALAVLGAMPAQSFIQAVVREQVQTLTGIPGVGKKTAQRVIIELKDKLAKLDGEQPEAWQGFAVPVPDATGDALQALLALGYNPNEAKRALGRIPYGDEELSTEEILRLALRELGKGK